MKMGGLNLMNNVFVGMMCWVGCKLNNDLPSRTIKKFHKSNLQNLW